jgi:hypothetical protein
VSTKIPIGVRILAALLFLGGIFGVCISLYLGVSLLPKNPGYLVLAIALLALFAFSALTGWRLWRGEPRGWKWATILYASQIPIFSIAGLSYEWYAGIAIRLVGGAVDSNLGFALGSNAEFYIGASQGGASYGINLFALVAYAYLKAVLPESPRPAASPVLS